MSSYQKAAENFATRQVRVARRADDQFLSQEATPIGGGRPLDLSDVVGVVDVLQCVDIQIVSMNEARGALDEFFGGNALCDGRLHEGEQLEVVRGACEARIFQSQVG